MKTFKEYLKEWDYMGDDEGEGREQFQDPGGRSALRRSSKSNPRIFPCPTCKLPNKLTARDKELGYQCDTCADREEGAF